MQEQQYTRPLLTGTRLVYYNKERRKEQEAIVKEAGMYMLWVEDLQNRDVTTFIRYSDLVWVLGQW